MPAWSIIINEKLQMWHPVVSSYHIWANLGHLWKKPRRKKENGALLRLEGQENVGLCIVLVLTLELPIFKFCILLKIVLCSEVVFI